MRPDGVRCWVREAQGAVMLEFLLAFVPLFVLFLGLLQLALLAVADLVVRHAAWAGARSACVVLDDDPERYGGAARGDVSEPSARVDVVRAAVYAPLAAIAPGSHLMWRLLNPMQQLSAADAIGEASELRALAAQLLYLPVATAVAFPSAPGAAELRTSLATADTVVVRVTHLLPCGVPLAGALLCRSLVWDGSRLSTGGADAGKDAELSELTHAVRPDWQAFIATSRVPMAVLQAEASMPAQRADYAYVSERDSSDAPAQERSP